MPSCPPKLRTYVVESVVEALGHTSQGRRFAQAEEPGAGDLSRLPLTAVIEFAGEGVKGALLLACGPEVLRATTPVKSAPKGKEDVYGRDWLGEAVNLMLGNLKRKFGNHGLSFKIGSPYYAHYVHTPEMALERFGEAEHEDGFVEDFWFLCNDQPLVVQLGLTTKETFA